MELLKLPRRVDPVAEEHAIEMLTPNRLDLRDLEDAEVGEAAVESKQRVVVGALAGLNILDTETSLRHAGSTPMMRRAKTSVTSITQ